MLNGHMQAKYPQWSRVIVSTYGKGVPDTTRHLRAWMEENVAQRWLCEHSDPHMHCKGSHAETYAVIAKSIWSLNELTHNLRGRDFEYAIDDAEVLMLGSGLYVHRPPAVITITGESVDNLRD